MPLREEPPSIGLAEDRRLIAILIIIGAVFLLGGSALVYVNQTFTALRPSIILAKDLFIGFFTVSGILVAVETLRRNALSSRKLLALRFVEQWNAERLDVEPHLTEIFRDDGFRASESLQGSPVARQKIIDLLNSCERIGIAVLDGSADERTIRERLSPAMESYFFRLSPLIQAFRSQYNDHHLFKNTERLLKRWGTK
ncbi:MAG TPA: DUF4760 domain-containing protein [Bryobacteraceae bacterium]|nr:DUF4760 domain-containing protein [Bryobacteraceae bacterium]